MASTWSTAASTSAWSKARSAPAKAAWRSIRTLGRAGFTDGLPGRLHRLLYANNEQVTLTFDNRLERFRLVAGAWVPEKGDGATLSGSGSSYTYRSADGTTVEYGAPGRSGVISTSGGNGIPYCVDDSESECELLPLSVVRPTGRRLNLYWTVLETCSGGDLSGQSCNWFPRLASIVNESNYMAKLRYASNESSEAGPSNGWFQRIGSRLINTMVESCDPAAADCTLSRDWPTISYDESVAGVTKVTDPAGREWQFTSSADRFTIRRPDSKVDNVVVNRGSDGVVTSVTRGGATTRYARTVSGLTATMLVTDALDQKTTIVSDLAIGRRLR